MKLLLSLVVFSLFLSFSLANESRLIAFSESHREWLSQSEIEQLMMKKVKFMDLTDYQVTPSSFVPAVAPIPVEPIHKEYVAFLIPNLNGSNIWATITSLSALNTRYYTSQTGVQGAQLLHDAFAAIARNQGRTDITVEKFTHTWAQPSIIATIPGRGPNKNEMVIIGGHEDSVGTSSTARAPGADDDASGVSTVLEIFRVLVSNGYYPDRTVKFMTYAGEEAGLLGSQAIATSFKNANTTVHGVLQLDMVGYGTVPNIGVVGDNVDRELTNFVKILIDAYCATLGWEDTTCGYGCSDHASWTRNGYRAAFPFETPFGRHNPYIHTASDTLDRLDQRRALDFARLGLGFVIEMADISVPP